MVPSKVWARTGLRLGVGFFLEVPQERGICAFTLACFLTQYFRQSCRGRSPKSPAVHPLEHRDLTLYLLFGVFWCLSLTHPHGALLPDSFCEPLATGFPPHWLELCQICGGCWHPLCSYIQVSVMGFSSSTVRCSGMPALGIGRKREQEILPCVDKIVDALVSPASPHPHTCPHCLC